MWERRKEKRFDIKRVVNAKVISEAENGHTSLLMTNISSTGACLISSLPMRKGMDLQLEIKDCPVSLVSGLGFWVKLQKDPVNLFAKAKVSRTGPGQKEVAVEFRNPPNVLNT